MISVDAAWERRIEEAVSGAEAGTDAEIVVVVAPRSGSYRDLAWGLASLATFALLVLVVVLPFEFHPWMVLIEIALAWPAFAWLLSAAPLVRAVASEARRAEQVRTAATVEFHAEMVHSTPTRTGVLVYLSRLERRVEIVPDVGIGGRIPRGEWDLACRAFDRHDTEGFVAGIAALGRLLAVHVPPREGDRIELADAPRVRA